MTIPVWLNIVQWQDWVLKSGGHWRWELTTWDQGKPGLLF